MIVTAWFLNLGPSSTTIKEAGDDIRAILATDPDLLLGCESVGKGDLPQNREYGKVRDRSTPGRSNLFAYAKGGLDGAWEDCQVKFPRAEHPHLGPHPPRAILKFPYYGAQIINAHKPPKWRGAGPAREEHDRRLTRIMAPWTDEEEWRKRNAKKRKAAKERQRILLWDRNMSMPEARAFADGVDGRVTGDLIDSAVSRNIEVLDQDYREIVDGHRLHTDHPWGAFFIKFRLKD